MMRFKIEIIEEWEDEVERISLEVETVPPSNMTEGNLKIKEKEENLLLHHSTNRSSRR